MRRPPGANPEGLPERIALVRVRLGLSQAAFAARIGVTRNSVINYERGHARPRAGTLRRIAAVGSVPVEALSNGPAPRWLRDGNWDEVVGLLRTVWREPSRRATAIALLRAFRPR